MSERRQQSLIFISSRRRHLHGAEKDLKKYPSVSQEMDLQADSKSTIHMDKIRKRELAQRVSIQLCILTGGVKPKRLTLHTTGAAVSIFLSD